MLSRLFGRSNAHPFSEIKHDSHLPAANNAATKTQAGQEGKRHILHKVLWSYSDAPTGGKLTITGGTDTLEIDIIAGGPGALSLSYVCAEDTDLVVTLAAATITGKLYYEFTTELA